MSRMARKVGILGLGRMGGCLARGLLAGTAPPDILFTTSQRQKDSLDHPHFKATQVSSNLELFKQSDVLLVAVKPQSVSAALAGLKATPEPYAKVVISIAAGVTLQRLEALLPASIALFRAMPNTPVVVQAGVTALSANAVATEADGKLAESLFLPLGKVVRVKEEQLNAVTGLSGCGPAYVFLILEALIDAGIKVGLPRATSALLAGQTLYGSAKMFLESQRHPAELRDEVTTPAGCTIDGLLELEEGKLRGTLAKAVVQATLRAGELTEA